MQDAGICYQACAHFFCKSSIWKLQHHRRDMYFIGIWGVKLSLPQCSSSFLSKQQEHSIFSHGNKWDAESLSSIHSFPLIPLPSVHWLPGSLCLSILCHLETAQSKEQ